MEEILASIRRIIADDQEGGAKPAPAPPAPQTAKAGPVSAPASFAPAEEDVLDLGEVATPVARAPSLDLEHEDIGYRDVAEMDFDAVEPDEAPPQQPEPALRFEPEPVPERLISSRTDTTVSGSFNMLAHTVLTHNARTLEDLVRDMLRPMLKSWLDENLPTLVERLVRAEIERVTRGR